MQRTAAITKAIDLMRAAGDDDGADALLAELDDELDAEPEIEVIEIEAEPEIEVIEPEPVSTGITAAAAGEVAIIEAQTDSQIELMEAAARIESERADAELERQTELVETIAEIEAEPDSDDPDPRTGHWFYRPLRRAKQ